MKFTALAGEQRIAVAVERRDGGFRVVVDGLEHVVDARKLEGDFYSLVVDGLSYEVSVEPDAASYRVRHGAAEQVVAIEEPGRRVGRAAAAGDGPASVLSVMPGKVVRLLVAEGDEVQAHQGLVVVEAMKMENEIAAPRAGRVRAIRVEAGRAVEAGETLVVIE